MIEESERVSVGSTSDSAHNNPTSHATNATAAAPSHNTKHTTYPLLVALEAKAPTPPTAPLLPPVLGLLALPIALLALTPLLLEALLLYTPLLELGRLDRPVVDDVERVLLFVFMFVAICVGGGLLYMMITTTRRYRCIALRCAPLPPPTRLQNAPPRSGRT